MAKEITRLTLVYYLIAVVVGFIASAIAAPDDLPRSIVLLLLVLPPVAGIIEALLNHAGHVPRRA